MENKSSMSRVERLRREKVTRYSIRKYSFGAASVAVAALFMFLGNGAVSADMTAVQPQDESELKVKLNDENTGLDKVQGDTTKQVDNTVVAEPTAKPAAQPAGEEPAKPALDTTKLEKYIAEIEAKLDNGTYANKTEESIALLKADLEAAKATLRNAKTQDEITKAYNKLVTTANTKLITKPVEKKETPGVDTTNGQPTVGKRAENTEPKEGTNAIENTGSHDSRNGKLIENGVGFRTEGNQAPTVELPYSNADRRQIYIYTGENTDLTFTGKDETIVKDLYLRNKGKDESDNASAFGFTIGKVTNSAVASGEGTVSADKRTATIKMTGVTKLTAPNKWTSFIEAKDNDGVKSMPANEPYNVESNYELRRNKPGYVEFIVKSQTDKYDIKAPTEKVAIADPANITEDDLAKIKEKLQLEYKQDNDDANIAKDTAVDKNGKIQSVTKDGNNFVVTYTDGSKDTVSKGLLVSGPAPTVDTVARSKDTIFSTDKKITGTGVVGATVKVTVRNPEKTEVLLEKETTVNAEGKWEISLDKGLNSNEALSGAREAARTFHVSKPKNPVEIIQTVDGIDSEAKNQEVSIGSSQILPSAASTDGKSVVAGAREVTLKVPHDSGFTYFWYTNKDNNQRPQLDIKRTDDGMGFELSGGNAGKATIKGFELGDFYDTVTLTLTENIKEGVDLEVISHNGPATHGYYLRNTKIPVTNEAPVVSAKEENKNEKEVPTDASVTKTDLLNLVKVTDHEDDLNATLGTKGNARIVSIDGDENAVKVDTSTAGEHTVIFRAVDSQGKESADYTYKIRVRQNNAPEVTIPYSVDGKKDVYVYANENFDIPIKYTDDTGKVVEASVRQGGNKALPQKAGQNDPNVLDNEYTMTVGKISEETKATAENPATIHITGNLSKTTPGLTASSFPTDENGEYPIVTRYATATDTDGKNISNNATGTSYATDPGGFRIVLKAQTAKYDIKALDDEHKTVVTNTAALTPEDLAAVKANLKLEFSKKNKDKNIDKTAAVENVGNAVDTVAQDGTNLVVTYKDGSKDTIALDKVVKLDKQPAIDDVNKKATEQIVAINSNNNLTKVEKDAAVAKVNEAKQAALDKIDDATNAADVTTAKTDGATAVGKVNPVAKDAAKKDIDKELKAKTDAIAAKTDLSDKEKEAAKAKAKKAADDAKAEIDNLADTAETANAATNAVTPGKQQATDNLAKVNPVAKEKALAKIDEALKAKEKEMDDRTDLTAEEKAEAKQAAKDIADREKGIINEKNDNEETAELASAAQTKINTAGTDGERDIKAVTKEAKVKPAAHKAVADAAEAKKRNIQENSALSDAAKEALKNEVDAIKEASKAAIDGAKKNADVEVAKKSAKAAIDAINSARRPGNKIVAANPTNLTDAEREKLKQAIAAVNPEGTTIVVNADGSAEVTLPGKKAPEIFKQEDLTRGEADLENPGGGNNINRPMDKVIVKNLGDLQPEEKEKILKAVRDVNPNAVVTINAAGVVTVSTPEGKTAAFPASELVRTLEDAGKDGAANTGVLKPADKLVGDATNADDQAKVTEKLKKLNGQDTKVKYDAEGNATVTSIETKPDGTKVYKTATIPAGDLFKTEEDTKKANGGDDINKPNSKTVVEDIAALSPEDLEKVKDAIKAKVEAVNPGAVVVVDNKGNAIVTTPEGKTAVIDADDLIKKSTELPNAKAGNNINNPADRVRVNNPETLTESEIAKIKAAVEAVNPGATVVVDAKGNVTVTTPDSPGVEGKTATIPVSELVKVDGDKTAVSGGNQVNTPADRVVVENPAVLNDDNKNAIKAKIQAVNPGADVVLDDKGNATVTSVETKEDGTKVYKTATIPVADLVKAKTDLADPTKQDAVNKPADKLVIAPELVDNPDADLSASKEAIKAAVEAVNPGSTVVVDDKGNATVTTKDGKTVVIPKADLVKKESDKENAKAGNSINKPVDRILVTDPANIDEATKKAIEEKVKAVNPDATVVVDEKGNATVTSPDGKTATIPVSDLVKTAKDAENPQAGNYVNKPADKVSATKEDLADPAKKDAVVEKIKAAIKAVNPEGTTVVVDDKGNATVTVTETNEDGTKTYKTATIPVEDLLKNPADKDKANAGNKVNTPATKVVVTSSDNKDADEEKIKAEILKVNPGATVVFDTVGNATVTTKDGAVATIPASDLAIDAKDLEKADKQDDVKKPVDKTIVKNPARLTAGDIAKIKAAVEKVNPSTDPANPTTVVVDNHGNATVTTPDGKTKVIPASELVKTQDQADGANAGNNVNKPADKISAKPADLEGADKEKLKTKIAGAIKAVNPEGTKVFIDDKGNATVTVPETNSDGTTTYKTATIPVEDLLKDPDVKESATAGNKVNTPADRVILDKDIAALSPEELAKLKEKIADKVKAINPDATVFVDEKGNATVTTKDGAVATIPAADLLKAKTDLTDPAKQPAVKIPVDQTVVANKDGLSEPEKTAIKDSVLRANPGATVFVDEKGNATVTTPDGKTAVIAADDLVKTQEDVSNDPKAGNLVNKPADGVFVGAEGITEGVKAKIKDKVQRVNPDATVFVDENGNAIVTTPEGKTVTIPVGDLTKTEANKNEVKAGNKISTPADRVLVKNREHLTAEDIKAIEKNIKDVNPDKDANNPTVVLFDEKGNATVTVTNPDGTKTTATIPVEDLVKPVAYLTNPAKQDLIKKPVDKVLIVNADNIGEDAKDAIKKAVLAVNPKEGTTVVVDDKGNATITTPDGKSFVIPAKDLVKNNDQAGNEKAGNDINKPSDKVVADPADFNDETKKVAIKKAIAKKIKAVNPDAKTITVFVDDEGNATVTVEDEQGNTTTATILAKDLVRTEEQAKGPNAGNNVNTPADKVVADPDNLTEDNKTAIAENIKSVNPGAKVAFDKYGNATVTTQDGAIATIPVKNLVKTQDEATKPTAGNNVNKPADKVVADPADFNDETKKAAIKKAIEDNIKVVNPGALVAVDDLGNATVTLPNGKTAVIPAKDLTKPSAEVGNPKAGNDIVKPADKTVVANPNALTDDERNAIGAKVSEVNPDAKYIAVDDKGNVTVTLNDGKVAVIPASDLTKTADEAAKPKAGNDVVKPADKTVVENPNALTQKEKDAIIAKIKAVNPDKDAEHPTKVVLDEKGNATVTTRDGKTAVIPAKDLTKKDTDEDNPKAGNDIVKPASKVKVARPEQLTDAEKKAIEDKVRAVNPEATSVVVDEKGNVTVTLPDGKTAVIPASDLTKSQDDITAGTAKENANVPAAKIKVADPTKLTPEEKKAIEDKVRAVNPEAKSVVVDENGNTTVVTKDGNVSVIPVSDLVKVKEDAEKENGGNDANTPAAKTVVGNPDSLELKEKQAIEEKVKAVNPEGTTVVVDEKGNATVTKPDGTVLNIPASDLVIPADKLADEAKNAKVKTPAFRTLVGNKEELKDFEKEAVKKAIEAVNPGATVVVDNQGNATVTLPDGSTATISKEQLVKDRDDAKGKHRGDNLDFDFSKVTVANLEKITKEEKVKFQFMILGAITSVPEFDLSSLEITKDDQGNTIYKSGNGAKMIIDEHGNATIVTEDGKKQAAISIDKKGNVTIVTKDGQVLAIPRDGAFRERVYYSQADSKTDKSKLESAIHQLDDLISNQADQLGAINTKEAKALLEEAKKVFENPNATQEEVDTMVQRIEDFMAKVSPSTDHATPANDQAAQTPAVDPATAQAAANASQEAANARKAAKELPNTGTADSTVAMVAAAASALLGLGLAGRRRKEDEEA